jgi:hypothetical protein
MCTHCNRTRSSSRRPSDNFTWPTDLLSVKWHPVWTENHIRHCAFILTSTKAELYDILEALQEFVDFFLTQTHSLRVVFLRLLLAPRSRKFGVLIHRRHVNLVGTDLSRLSWSRPSEDPGEAEIRSRDSEQRFGAEIRSRES